MEILSYDNVRLRPLEPEDVDYLLRWENDPDVWMVSDTVAPFSRHCIEQYVLNYDADVWRASQLRLMIQISGRELPVGMIDLYNLDRTNLRGFIGIFVEPELRRREIARNSLKILSRYAHAILGLRQLDVVVEIGNKASCELFETSGFVRCGVLLDWRKRGTQYYDVVLYQKLLGNE